MFTEPLGRALLGLLTTDHGRPGDPRRRVLLRELHGLRAAAEAQDAPTAVQGAIRSALRALRAEFPVDYSNMTEFHSIGSTSIDGGQHTQPF